MGCEEELSGVIEMDEHNFLDTSSNPLVKSFSGQNLMNSFPADSPISSSVPSKATDTDFLNQLD